jgi:NhaP-type Na+/H+ and K+/H+ antiporter
MSTFMVLCITPLAVHLRVVLFKFKFKNHLLTNTTAFRTSAVYTAAEVLDELKKVASEKSHGAL